MDLSVTNIKYTPSFCGVKKIFTKEYMAKNIVPYVEADIPYKQVLKDHKISIRTLDDWANEEYGVPFRKLYHTTMNKALGERLRRKNASGDKLCDIARSEGHSTRWVNERLKDFEILRPYEQRCKLFEKYVPSMIKQGFTLDRMIKELKKVAENITVSDSLISEWIGKTYKKRLPELRAKSKIYIDRENVDYLSIKRVLEDIFRNGGSITDASKATGISKARIFYWIDRFDIPTKMREAKQKLDSILELRMAQGYNSKEIAGEAGVSYTTVTKRAKTRYGMTFSEAQKMLMETYFTKH